MKKFAKMAYSRLAARCGFEWASILLGLVWATWHLPLFFLPGNDNYGKPFPMFVVAVIALSAAMTWLYAHPNGSLLLVMLMHSAMNQTAGILPSASTTIANPFTLSTSLVPWLTVIFLCVGPLSSFVICIRGPLADRRGSSRPARQR